MKDSRIEPQAQTVREAVAEVLGRDRRGGPSSLDRAVGDAAGRLLALGPDHGRAGTLRAAAELAKHGDQPGARLLLRAVTRVAPDPLVAGAVKQLRPPGAVARRVAVTVAVVLGVGLLVVALIVGALAGAEAVAGGLLIGSVAPVLAARLAWTRFVRVPGLTLQESYLWRSLGVLRRGDSGDLAVLGDGRLRRAISDLDSPRAQRLPSAWGRPDGSGWVGLAGVTGAVLCLAAGLAFPGLPSGAFLLAMPLGAGSAAVAVWAALRRARERAERHPKP
jgi:hypothetical protein